MSINYGYFRHKLDASNDTKLQSVIDDLGLIGYAYYFTLLEVYGTAYNNSDKSNTEVKIHQRVIANTWRKRVDSCDKVLTKLQLSGILVYTKQDSTYTIDIPNFLKYFGSYGKTKEKQTLNKIKENKIKENKINIYITPDEIVNLWNQKMPKHGFKYCHGLGSNKYLHQFLESAKYLQNLKEWDDLFERCVNMKSLKGENNIKWIMPLTWLVDYDNALKIINGDFEREEKNLFAFLQEIENE